MERPGAFRLSGRWSRENREIAVRAADEAAVLIELCFDIGDALALVKDGGLARQPAFAHADMIVEFDFQGRADQPLFEQAHQRAAHGGIGERIGNAAVRNAVRVEMAFAFDIDRHRATPVAALDHLQAERARELEILAERPHRTRLNELGDHRRAAAGAGGACRAAAVPDRRGRNARRNRGSRGSPLHRRNGNRARPGAPSASGRCGR